MSAHRYGRCAEVFIAQTDARNEVNGRASRGHSLVELENRAFLNQITRVDCSGERCTDGSRKDGRTGVAGGG